MKVRMSISALIVILFISISQNVHAQYETMMLNQMMNDMWSNYNKQQNEIYNTFMKVIKSEAERTSKLASASCLILPDNEDRFYAYVTPVYLSVNDIKLVVTDAYGNEEQVSTNDYLFETGAIITTSIFKPGMTVSVKHRVTEKVFSTITIPHKSSASYETFVRNGRITVNALTNSAINSLTGENNRDNSSITTQSTCSLCHGKGWISGSKTPTYGNNSSYWCETCKREVNASHSHDKCPSCSGKGYIMHIK